MIKTRLLALAGTAVLATLSTAASAATIYDLAPNQAGGDCVFNTACGPSATGDTYAAQMFTLASAATLSTGSFSAYTNSPTQPSGVNWAILAADGSGGLPGTVLSSGTGAFNSVENIGSGFGFGLNRYAFDVAGSLGAGSYYFAFQAISTDRAVYEAFAGGTGAATSTSGTSGWTAGYRGASAVASSLESADVAAVPEPATWGLMIAGFGLVGGAMRRRSTKVAFAA